MHTLLLCGNKTSRLTPVYFDPTGFLLSFGVLLEMMTTWIMSSYNIYAFNILSICVCAIGLFLFATLMCVTCGKAKKECLIRISLMFVFYISDHTLSLVIIFRTLFALEEKLWYWESFNNELFHELSWEFLQMCMKDMKNKPRWSYSSVII